MQVLHLGYFFPLQNRSAIVYFMFCCTILGLGDPVIILIWQKQGLLPMELIILLLPQPRQHFHVTSLVPGLTDWDGSGKATHLSCHYFVSFQSSLFPQPFYCVATWTSTWIQGKKCENGKGRHMAPHAHLTHRYSAGDAAVELCSNPPNQNGKVRNICASKLLFLLVIPQFIRLFY